MNVIVILSVSWILIFIPCVDGFPLDYKDGVVSDTEFQLEPTPVLFQSQSSTSYSMGWTPKGSSSKFDPAYHEGSGRNKRDYNLEDFLMWTPSGDGPLEQFNKHPRNTDWIRPYTRTIYVTTTTYATITVPPGISPEPTQRNTFPTRYSQFGSFGSFGKSFPSSFGEGRCRDFQNDSPPDNDPTEPNNLFFPPIIDEAFKHTPEDLPDYFPTHHPFLQVLSSSRPNYHEITDFLHPSLGYEGNQQSVYHRDPFRTSTPILETRDRIREPSIRNTRRPTISNTVINSIRSTSTVSTSNRITHTLSFPTTSKPISTEVVTSKIFSYLPEVTTEISTTQKEITSERHVPPTTDSFLEFTTSPDTTSSKAISQVALATYTSNSSTTTSPITVPITTLFSPTITEEQMKDTNIILSYSTEAPTSEETNLIHPLTTIQSESPIILKSSWAETTTNHEEDISTTITTNQSTKQPIIPRTVLISGIPSVTSTLLSVIPSPSNNLTAPLDKKYWIRTVLNGNPKSENKLTFKNEMTRKLATIYQYAYDRLDREQYNANNIKRKRRHLRDMSENTIPSRYSNVVFASMRRLLQLPINEIDPEEDLSHIHYSFVIPLGTNIKRIRRRIETDISVRIQNITNFGSLNTTELVYSVFIKDEPVPALEAVRVANNINQTEMEDIFNYTLAIKAEEYLKAVPFVETASNEKLIIIIGSVTGLIVMVLIVILIIICLYNNKRKTSKNGSGGYSPRSTTSVDSPGIDNPGFPSDHDEESTREDTVSPDLNGRRRSTSVDIHSPIVPPLSSSRNPVPIPRSSLLPPSRKIDSEEELNSDAVYSRIEETAKERGPKALSPEPRYSSPKTQSISQLQRNIHIGASHSRYKLPGGELIPGTNLPKFLPPQRPQFPFYPTSPMRVAEDSALPARDFSSLEDQQWIRPEDHKPDILPSQVQDRPSLDRSASAISRGSSELDMTSSETPGGIGRLRRRFHDLLDDAFGLMQGQKSSDKVTPFATPRNRRTVSRDTKSAMPPTRSCLLDELDRDGGSRFLERPQTHLRPWSATAIAGSSRGQKDLINTNLSGESGVDDSPRSAWGDYSRRSITPINLPTAAFYDRPDSAPMQRTSISSEGLRSPTPIDPDTGLKLCDPAVPLIRAIKEELSRFKSTVNTDSSTA